MTNYGLTYLKNYEDANNAPIRMIAGSYKGQRGIIKKIYTPRGKSHSSSYASSYVVEIYLPKSDISLYLSDLGLFRFVFDIQLQDGKKYITMNGNIVTMHKDDRGNCFHDDNEDSYEPNGFAYLHHNNGKYNILKEYVD